MRNVTDGAGSQSRPRRVVELLLLYVLIPAVLLGCVWGYLSFTRYVDRDPAFCATCHESRDEFALWTKSEHKEIVCQDCHHQSEAESLRVLVAYTMGEKADANKSFHVASVSIDDCASCHLRHDAEWPQIGGSLGHRVHLESGKVSCLDCHARSIHKFGATSESCGECHGAHDLRTTGMEGVHCLACHDFLTLDETIKPSRRTCLECHRSSGLLDLPFPENAAMAKLNCWACHRPHVTEGPTNVACTSCHERLERHGLHAIAEHDACEDCHPAHTWKPSRRGCTECHEGEVSHYAHESCWAGACHSFMLEEEGEEGPK